jgi:CRP-like cAMP-binding protein
MESAKSGSKVIPFSDGLETAFKNGSISVGDFIRKVPFLQNVDDDTIANFAARAVLLNYQDGQTIAVEGDSPSGYYIIIQGRVKVCKQTRTGKNIILKLLGPYDSFGDMHLFDGEPLSVTALAHGKVLLLSMVREEFLEFAINNPDVAMGIITNITKRYKEIQGVLVDQIELTVQQRVARKLLYLFTDIGRVLNFTHQDIAEMVGTHRENTSRALEHLEHLGIITTTRKNIQLLDAEKILDYVSKSGHE